MKDQTQATPSAAELEMQAGDAAYRAYLFAYVGERDRAMSEGPFLTERLCAAAIGLADAKEQRRPRSRRELILTINDLTAPF